MAQACAGKHVDAKSDGTWHHAMPAAEMDGTVIHNWSRQPKCIQLYSRTHYLGNREQTSAGNRQIRWVFVLLWHLEATNCADRYLQASVVVQACPDGLPSFCSEAVEAQVQLFQILGG